MSFSIGTKGGFVTREAAAKYAVALHADDCAQIAERVRKHLGGMNLACWCGAGQACHADTLLRIANAAPEPA